MAASDAIVIGEDWISEHYFTTDAKTQSFAARVLERRKSWEEHKDSGTTRTRFTAARAELLSTFAGLGTADACDSRTLNDRLRTVLGYDAVGLRIDRSGPVTRIGSAGLSDTADLAVIDARSAEAIEQLLDKDSDNLLEPYAFDEKHQVTSVSRLISTLFVVETPPAFVLVLAGRLALVAERERWPEGRYLAIDLQLICERSDDRRGGEVDRALTCLSAESLAPDAEGDIWWQSTLEESVKHTVGVSKDLREGVRLSIEIIANEVVTRRAEAGLPPLSADQAQPLAKQSLRFLYRILFLLYAEASPELGVLPTGAPEYERGYSLDRLRDLTLVELATPQSRTGTHLYDSLSVLFGLVEGKRRGRQIEPDTEGNYVEGLEFRSLRADLFAEEATAHIDAVGLGNERLQEVLRHLLLSKEARGRDRGFISYAELGINQLGAVYEGLMSYTGFFAETDLYEVAKGGDSAKGSWVVPVERADGIAGSDFVKGTDPITGEEKPILHRRGTFVFRLAGRERQQSASYYTPEVLTRFVVSQALEELNLGRLAGHGSTRSLAGEDRDAAMFRVCSSCGQLDNATGRNAATEHRPWCPLRKALEEDTRSVALMRSLTTEGLVLRIPVAVSLGDSFAMPSLAAAVLLGLREHLGGAPDHIAVEAVVDPTLSDGSDNRPALLLHDVVPGGTGYLAELADAETLRSILLRAYEVVRDCACREEGRASCHRCLLPFAGPGGHSLVSRVAAERHLKDILKGGEHSDDEPDPLVGWVLTEDENTGFDPETHIEQKFRQVLRERLQPLGAIVQEQPGEHGNRLVITLGGTGRIWTLDPQQFVLDSRPDFVLRTQGNVPDVVIFCDGWKYHASPAFNRLADDASKRRNLRDAGNVVIGLSWRDLESDPPAPPAWLNDAMIAGVTGMSGGALKPSVTELLRGGPLDFLIQWIQAPDPDGLSTLADWLPMFLLGRTRTEGVSDGSPIDVEAAGLLRGLSLTGSPTTAWAWQDDDVVLLARKSGQGMTDTEVALVLTDTDERLGQSHADSWRAWLRLGNLLNLRTRPTTITVTSSVGRELPAEGAAELPSDLPENLRADFAMAGSGQRELMLALIEAGIEEAAYGVEVGDGIPVDVAWPAHRMAVDLDLTDQDKDDLTEAGWTIVPPLVDDIQKALSAAEG